MKTISSTHEHVDLIGSQSRLTLQSQKIFFKMQRIALLLLTVTAIGSLSSCNDDNVSVSPLDSAAYKTFNSRMRQLWSDHGLWTRNVIINFVDGAPGTTEAVNRLLKNQEDLGDAIKPYYGDAAGNALTELLKEHITIAADILTAATTGDTPGFDSALAAWYKNADDIAIFLNAANPDHWDLNHWKQMMKTHLDLTLEEATARINKDYEADIIAYDKVYDELLMMADMLSEGIALQFPDKF
jgi:hypothetical protein